jgi:hypothetical protein
MEYFVRYHHVTVNSNQPIANCDCTRCFTRAWNLVCHYEEKHMLGLLLCWEEQWDLRRAEVRCGSLWSFIAVRHVLCLSNSDTKIWRKFGVTSSSQHFLLVSYKNSRITRLYILRLLVSFDDSSLFLEAERFSGQKENEKEFYRIDYFNWKLTDSLQAERWMNETIFIRGEIGSGDHEMH